LSVRIDGMSLAYAYQKLWQSVDCLIGNPPLKSRLEGALINITFLRPHATIPADALPDWKAIEAVVAEAESGSEGRIANALKSMTDEEAARLAGKIFRLFRCVARDYAKELMESGQSLDMMF